MHDVVEWLWPVTTFVLGWWCGAALGRECAMRLWRCRLRRRRQRLEAYLAELERELTGP
jgi:hypothetical protein